MRKNMCYRPKFLVSKHFILGQRGIYLQLKVQKRGARNYLGIFDLLYFRLSHGTAVVLTGPLSFLLP